MKLSTTLSLLVTVAIIGSLCTAITSRAQTPVELDSAARARIEQSRVSIVTVTAEDDSAKSVTRSIGFLIRNDLVATEIPTFPKSSPQRVTVATRDRTFKVLSWGSYFLPYVLLEKQTELSPLALGDSEPLKVNDNVYVISDHGEISAATITGTTTVKRDRAFLISLPVNSSNKGAPVFNRNGEVIGITAESPDGGSTGLVFPSTLLSTLKHLGEPSVGAGRGDGPLFQMQPAPSRPEPTPASQVDSKPVRLSSPSPRYTEEARANNIQGSVSLRILIGDDGTVKQVRVVSALPYGLTEQAIAVAKQAKFKPAMKDGKPVPFWAVMQLEFHIP